jgi:hypothetical protein
MFVRRIAVIAVSAIAIGLGAGAAAAQAAHFEGTVVAKNKSAKTFTLQHDEGGGTFKFKVNAATKYQRIAGFAAIKPGAKNIEVTARQKSNGRWIATQVERSGKSGGGGGGGADDGPNHT